ncbi:MAG: tRNA pseudouridine(55) synthase TruB [Eubacteriales bacterium]|nr:tRNA pseudouridine(55) synthase TruB [Eubacteriales bacterium]
MNGIINVYKPLGISSHGVVSRVRHILNMKRVGHTGTLDPMAEGVLPICVGQGTKASDMLTDSDKQYRAVLRLGVTTDSQDMQGAIIEEREVNCTEDQIRAVVGGFIGEISQIPPMYSAIKVDGKKLYELARKGIEIERSPRQITIKNIVVEEVNLPFVTLLVDCSKGTYIRTLCHDIGERLGTGGAMDSLVRTKAGGFSIEDAISLEQLEADGGEKHLVGLNQVFGIYPAVIADEKAQARVLNGQTLKFDVPQGTYRVINKDGTLLCISDANDGVLKMKKSFYGGSK